MRQAIHIVCCSLVLVSAQSASGLVMVGPVPEPSVEWGVAHADCVVRGTARASNWPLGSIQVHEVLVGKPAGQLHYRLGCLVTRQPLIPVEGREYIFCLTAEGSITICEMAIPLDGSARELDLTFKEIRTRDKVLGVVRKAVEFRLSHATKPAVPLTLDLRSLRAETSGRSFRLESRLIVPIDERLPGAVTVWSKSDDPTTRFCALEVISREMTISRHLAPWARDAAGRILGQDATVTAADADGRWTIASYGIRQYAADLLDVSTRPDQYRSFFYYHPISLHSLLALCLLFLVTLLLLTRAATRRRALIVILVILLLAVPFVWLRSRRMADGLAAPLGGSVHEFAVFNGALEYGRLNDAFDDPRIYIGHIPAEQYPLDLSDPATMVTRSAGFTFARGQTAGIHGGLHLFYLVRIPLWPFPILLLLGGCALIRRPLLLRRRRRLGLCLTCGYDLRASPDACPECGRARHS